MIISCRISTRSIGNAVKQLEKYDDSLKTKSEELVQNLGEYGEDYAANNLGHVDTGETLGSLSFTRKENEGIISISGAAVWIEFGTGVIANAGNSPHPKKDELGMSRWGEYGKGFGKGVWFYPSKEHGWDEPKLTAGIPMNPFMYNSAMEMRRELVDMAREVFKRD